MSRSFPKAVIYLMTVLFLYGCSGGKGEDCLSGPVLEAEDFRHHIDYFIRMEEENILQAVPNSDSWEWLMENIPLFE